MIFPGRGRYPPPFVVPNSSGPFPLSRTSPFMFAVPLSYFLAYPPYSYHASCLFTQDASARVFSPPRLHVGSRDDLKLAEDAPPYVSRTFCRQCMALRIVLESLQTEISYLKSFYVASSSHASNVPRTQWMLGDLGEPEDPLMREGGLSDPGSPEDTPSGHSKKRRLD